MAEDLLTNLQMILLATIDADPGISGTALREILANDYAPVSRPAFSQAMARLKRAGYVTAREDDDARFAIKPQLYWPTKKGQKAVADTYTAQINTFKKLKLKELFGFGV